MTRLQIVVYEYSRGIDLDLSNRAIQAKMSQGKHGSLRLDVTARLDPDEAHAFYQLAGTPTVELNVGPDVIWRGRAETIAVEAGEMQLVALGKWRALSDISYTALWSDASVAEWQKLTEDNVSTDKQRLFEQDNNNRLYIAARNPEPYVNTDLAAWGYQIPDGSSRNIVACQFAYTLGAGVNWRARLLTRDSAWGSGSAQWTLAGAVGAQSGVQNLTFAGAAGLTFELEATAGVTIAAATGAGAYLKITNLRLATTTTNRVNTTIAAGVGAPGAQTVTPVSMAGIYVGQDLWIGSAGTGEIVNVTSVTSTTFNATFANTHLAGVTVKAIVVWGDEVVEDILSLENSLNGQLAAATMLIESPGVDMVDAVYLDRDGMKVIEDIAQRGDSAGNAWETGVYDNVLYLRSLGDDALDWAVDARIRLERDVEQLANEVLAVHKNASDALKRTAATSDVYSQEQWGLTRQRAVDVHTTLAIEAEKVRDVASATQATPAPRVSLVFDQVFSSEGSAAEGWMAHAGDSMLARNAPPTMGIPPDNSASFRLTRVDYDVIADRPGVEVEALTLVNRLAESADKPVVNGQRKPFLIAARGN